MAERRERQIELTVRLTDGSFDSRVELPIDASDDKRDAVVQSWFGLMRTALEACRSADSNRKKTKRKKKVRDAR